MLLGKNLAKRPVLEAARERLRAKVIDDCSWRKQFISANYRELITKVIMKIYLCNILKITEVYLIEKCT